jgi:GTP-binding protein
MVNRIVAKGDAIVEKDPGVTRDRNYFTASWRGRDFRIVDTGGMDPVSEEKLTLAIGRQAMLAVEEADLVLMMVDAAEGITAADEEVAQAMRRSGKAVILAANKVDNQRQEDEAVEWYSLGMGEPWPVSAMHGRNIGDLLDMIVESLPEPPQQEEEEGPETVVAIVGRPNVGKSTLFNRLLREERSIISDIPGTTRDAVDTVLEVGDTTYRFIDTAGWRKRTKIREGVEFYSQVRVWKAIDRAQVVLLVVDASMGVTEQDQRIAARVKDDGRACVVILNKWDQVKAAGDDAKAVYEDALEKLHFVSYAPFLRVSALTGLGVSRLLPVVDRVRQTWESRVQTSHLNELLHRVLSKTPPPTRRGKRLQMYYLTQARTAPPQFVFFVNRPDLADPAYERFLERKIRETFDFEGTPIRVMLRSRRALERRQRG